MRRHTTRGESRARNASSSWTLGDTSSEAGSSGSRGSYELRDISPFLRVCHVCEHSRMRNTLPAILLCYRRYCQGIRAEINICGTAITILVNTIKLNNTTIKTQDRRRYKETNREEIEGTFDRTVTFSEDKGTSVTFL